MSDQASSTHPIAAAGPSAPRLELRGVSKAFPTGPDQRLEVIRDVSLTVAEGEFVAVVGASGSGKTTLLNLAASLVPADEGTVLVDGVVCDRPGPDRGVIFQQYAVFPWLSVRRNIEFGLRLRCQSIPADAIPAIVDRYVRLMGLEGFEDTYPKALSGGMRQRVAIGRAYAANPNILLMDEPFGALDAQTRDRMQEVLLDILAKDRRSVLFVTHSVEEALFLANRVAILGGRPGRMLEVLDVPYDYPRDPRIRLENEFIRLRSQIETSLHP